MLNIVLLGCGRWGKLILRDLKSLGVSVAVLAHGPISQANASAGGADVVVSEFHDLPEADAYVVAVPTSLHAQYLLRLLGNNKPIFCEKPLADDVAEARRIVAAAGSRLFIMDKWRYHGGVLALKSVATSGELGPVQGIKTVRVQWDSPHDDVDMDWILLPHDLSIALEVLGFIPEPVTAQAEKSADGRLISLCGTLASGQTWMQFEVGIRSPSHRRLIELRCRDGIATLSDAYVSAITLLRTDNVAGVAPLPQSRPVDVDMPLLKELAAFLAYVTGVGQPPRSSAADGLLIVERIADLRHIAGLQ